MPTPTFSRYLGIDYSGAGTPEQRLAGIRVYRLEADEHVPREIFPVGCARRWGRRALAEWLETVLREPVPTLVGIDHALSFPLEYFVEHGLRHDWPAFLDDFQCHWPTDAVGVRVEDVRRGRVGAGAARSGDARWRRLTDRRAGGAKSVFHFDVPGSVAKSTHAGLPWVRLLRARLGERLHCWPFDGWTLAPGRSVLVEAYPALYRDDEACGGLTPDQCDARAVALWLAREDRAGRLDGWLAPSLDAVERDQAAIEGWILGAEQSLR
ncbi:hypothetical protein MARPU_11205 [Marichromatium purpuratum 984]|uniref:DUF429 domain-containing protein n=1 Tax=Marichromatium purpuratum 984 TaxID=765910 RepID=W0E560_MARPU|nr:hypothetical protein [Marichromatium purpuratum]AHF04349.1 hypothetical protein MARPU_11205 [Marichromatium purpuratum 984]